MSDASRDGAGTWHRVGLWQGTLAGAADGAKRDMALTHGPPVSVSGGGTGPRQRRSSHRHLAWHPGRELGETAGILTPWLSSGGFSTAPARDVAGLGGCTSGCTSGCASTPALLRQEQPRGQREQRALPASSSAKIGKIGNLGADRDRQGSGSLVEGDPPGFCPSAVSFPAAAAGVSPSRGEGVKIQALSRLKPWMESGEGRGTHKGTRHKKPLSEPVLSGPFLCRWGNLKSDSSSAGPGCTPCAGTSRTRSGCWRDWGSRFPEDRVPVVRVRLWHCSPQGIALARHPRTHSITRGGVQGLWVLADTAGTPKHKETCSAPNADTGEPENPTTSTIQGAKLPTSPHALPASQMSQPVTQNQMATGSPRSRRDPPPLHPGATSIPARRLSPSAPSIVSAAGSLDYF